MDKCLILWEVNFDEANNEYIAKELHKVETKNYMDFALSQNRLVAIGC